MQRNAAKLWRGQSAFIQSATYFAGKLNDESDLTDATTKSRTVGGYQARY